jgi:hypothetical protein
VHTSLISYRRQDALVRQSACWQQSGFAAGGKPKWILNAVSQEKVTIVWLLVPWAQDILDAIESGEVNLKDYELDQWR